MTRPARAMRAHLSAYRNPRNINHPSTITSTANNGGLICASPSNAPPTLTQYNRKTKSFTA